MANAPEIVGIALKLKPNIVCVVPERRLEVTTEGGLDVAGQYTALKTSLTLCFAEVLAPDADAAGEAAMQ